MPPASKPPGNPRSRAPPGAGRAPPGRSRRSRRRTASRIAVLVDLAAVVARPLVLVGQQVIGLGHLGEALGRLGIVLVAVGVKLLGEAAIGLLDLGLARPALDARACWYRSMHALHAATDPLAFQMGCRRGRSKPKRRSHGRRSLRLVRRLVRRGEGGRAQRSGGDGARDGRRRRPAVGAHGAAQGPWAGRLRLLHQRRQPQGRASWPPIPQAALALPLEVAAPPGAHRRPGRAGAGDAEADAYFATPQPGFAARRLGVRPVAPARQPRNVRARATTRCSQRFDGQPMPRPPHWGGYRVDPAAASNSGPTGRTACTSAGCSRRRRRLERRAALPMTSAATHAAPSARS